MKKLNSFLLVALAVVFGSCKEQKKEVKVNNIASSEVSVERPNILMILCDDLGYNDVGFNGSNEITTPALDNLATDGIIFSDAYVTHPFCGPSRTSIMTGVYAHKIGAQFNHPPNVEQELYEGISLDEKFIAKVLDESGYYTGLMGKWHLGTSEPYHPNNRGFDEFYGFLHGGHDYFPEEYRKKYEAQKARGAEVIWEYLLPLQHNGKEVRETEYITDALSREAVNFVENASKKEDPFFLWVSYNAPHVPLQAKEEDLKLFEHIDDKDRRTYAAMVYAVDRGVKRIVESLQATNQLDNTLIVFFSDNGGKLSKGANNDPLQEGKGSTMEGGYRVPMFMHWPAQLQKGAKVSHPISSLDLYPTFANLAGAKIPESKTLDGKDVMSAIKQGSDPYKNDYIFALRHREGYTDVGARLNEWKVLKTNQNDWKLFNIENDISEQNDLSDQYPDKLYEMVKRAEAWSKTHAEPRWFTPMSLGDVWKEKDMASFGNTFEIKKERN